MDLIKRIGTQKKKFKLQFFIGRLKFSALCPGKIYIVIRRGNHKVKSEQKLLMSEDFKLNFNKQILDLEVTLFFDQKQNKYQQKLGEINIVVLDSKSNKALLGVVPFDVAEYANTGQQSIKQKRNIQQMPKKLQGLIQFNVFIKYIGEGSESSLDKISDFFFGKAKQPQSQQKIQVKEDGPGTYLTKKKKTEVSDQQQNDDNKMSKTEVKIHKMDDSSKKNYMSGVKLHNSGKQIDTENFSISKNFYFDEPQINKGEKKIKKKDKHRSNSMQKIKNPDEQEPQQDNGKMSKTNWGKKQTLKYQNAQEQVYEKDHNKKQKNSQYGNKQTFTNNNSKEQIQQLQRLLDYQTQQKELLMSKLQQSQTIVRKLQKQLMQTKTQNEKLIADMGDLQQELKSKQSFPQEKQRKYSIKAQNTHDPQVNQQLKSFQQELRKLQKQKNQLVVQNSKLKQKYKEDFKKYEQLLSEKDELNNDLNQTGKLQLLRMKEQCVKYRQTIQKLTKQKNEKALQLNRQRQQNKKIDEQMAGVKNTLSQMKIKLCNKLNQAIVTNDETLINLLMEINKES